MNRFLDEIMSVFFKNYLTADEYAVNLCKEKAEAGDYNAMLWFARMYRDGKGVKKNKSKASGWYKKSKDNNVFSRFELLVMLSNQERKFKDIPEGLKIDLRKKERLFVYKFDNGCMDLLVHLFPFTYYNVVGFSYEDEMQIGNNEGCNNYDKILIADINNSTAVRNELISKGVPAEKIIIIKKYLNKDEFDGDAIICDFNNKPLEKKGWVIVPNTENGLLWFSNNLKKFKGGDLSEYDYVIDMQNHFSQMMDIDNIGYYNPWDYYFEPISPLTLEKAYSSGGVIISKWVPHVGKRIPSSISSIPSELMFQRINTESELFIGRKKVLGVIARGTDYISVQPFDHPIPLDENELIEIVNERMESLGFTDIYLSTEDQDIYEIFNEHFGNKLITINQNRFKKGLLLNPIVLDKNIDVPFGKLIQGERYLIATHLTTKCELVLVGPGSGQSYIQKNSKGNVVERHIKGMWGLFGGSPIIICSHNKNHLSIVDFHDKSSAQFIDFARCKLESLDCEAVLNNIYVYLKKGVSYICSFAAKEPESLLFSIELFSENGKSIVYKLKQNDVFVAPFDTISGNVIIKPGSSCNLKVGIQIEEGTISTDYEQFRYSWTQICVKDVDSNIFASGDIDYIDFDRGVFSVHDIERMLDFEELKRYHEIICFNGGYLTYHVGKYHGNKGLTSKTTIEKTINTKNIMGRPKQLRRFSHTVELADYMMECTKGEVEEALCIYYYHAANDNVIAMYRLGCIYRDGKGVDKDINKAIEWMRKSSDKWYGWSRSELMDLLWQRGNPQDLTEMRNVAELTIEKGDSLVKAGALGRLGRIYRDGKGVEKNIGKAIEFMQKAAEINHVWNKELQNLQREKR